MCCSVRGQCLSRCGPGRYSKAGRGVHSMNFKERLAAFKPGFDAIPLAEKFRSAAAALAGTLLLGWALHFLPEVGYPLSLLASMAAAAVLLFAVPHSPMAQPWPLLVGNLLSGVVGWGCSLLIPDPVVGRLVRWVWRCSSCT